MTAQHEIRLGAVKCSFDTKHGLRIRSVHPPDLELAICQSDLPELMTFLSQYMAGDTDTVRMESNDSVDELRAPSHSRKPGSGDQGNVSAQRPS